MKRLHQKIACLSVLSIMALDFTLPDASAQLFNRKNARVIVSASASPEYEALKASLLEDRVLTYHIMPGGYYGGETRDASLENHDFQLIADDVARRLKEKELYPSPTIDAADLLIRISWGTTDIPIDWTEVTGGEDSEETADVGGAEDSEEVSDPGEGTVEDGLPGSSVKGKMARLIGFDKAMRSRKLLPSDIEDYETLLKDERYFIVVQAFDFKKLVNDKEVFLYWTTRYSMDAVGTSFDEAYLSLSRAAATYFGEDLDDVAREKVNIGRGEGRVGELEVIGVEQK